jgi:hypothetical protein
MIIFVSNRLRIIQPRFLARKILSSARQRWKRRRGHYRPCRAEAGIAPRVKLHGWGVSSPAHPWFELFCLEVGAACSPAPPMGSSSPSRRLGPLVCSAATRVELPCAEVAARDRRTPWFEVPCAMAAGARGTNAVVDLLHQSILIQLLRRWALQHHPLTLPNLAPCFPCPSRAPHELPPPPMAAHAPLLFPQQPLLGSPKSNLISLLFLTMSSDLKTVEHSSNRAKLGRSCRSEVREERDDRWVARGPLLFPQQPLSGSPKSNLLSLLFVAMPSDLKTVKHSSNQAKLGRGASRRRQQVRAAPRWGKKEMTDGSYCQWNGWWNLENKK